VPYIANPAPYPGEIEYESARKGTCQQNSERKFPTSDTPGEIQKRRNASEPLPSLEYADIVKPGGTFKELRGGICGEKRDGGTFEVCAD